MSSGTLYSSNFFLRMGVGGFAMKAYTFFMAASREGLVFAVIWR